MNKKILIFKYFSKLLLKNKFLWLLILIIFTTIITVPIVIIELSNKENILETNALLILAPIFISLNMFIAILSILLFVRTKKNNVDLYIYMQPISKKWIFLIKQAVIISFSFIIIIPTIILAIVLSTLGLDFSKMIELFLAFTFNIILMSFIWTIFYAFLGQKMSFWIGMFSISAMFLTVSLGFIFPIVVQKSTWINYDYNISNKRNLIKISGVDENGEKTKEVLGIYENPLAKNDNSLKPAEPSRFLSISPFNIVPGLMSPMMISINGKLNNTKPIDTHWGVRYLYIKNNKNETINSRRMLITSYGEKSIFDYNKEDLFNELLNQIKNMSSFKEKINDGDYWKLSLDELKSQKIWNNITDNQKKAIIEISGINTSKTLIYNIFKNNDIANKRIANFFSFLSEKTNPQLSDFVKYIWYSKSVKLNMFSYDSLGDLSKYETNHINFKNYDEFAKASNYDIEKFKNKIFHAYSNNGVFTLQYLDGKSIYRQVNNLDIKKIFGRTFTTKNDFDEYIYKNSTINNLKSFYDKAFALFSGDIEQFKFNDNVTNNMIIYEFVEFGSKTKFQFTWLILLIVMVMVGAVQYSQIKNMTKKDLI